MRTKTICLLGIGLYAVLSVADFALTFTLIDSGKGFVYEANPVAAAHLDRNGWEGLAAYKFGGVAVFVGAVGLLTARKPKVAAGVIGLGCAVLLGVTGYSAGLLRDARRAEAERAELIGLAGPIEPPTAGSVVLIRFE